MSRLTALMAGFCLTWFSCPIIVAITTSISSQESKVSVISYLLGNFIRTCILSLTSSVHILLHIDLSKRCWGTTCTDRLQMLSIHTQRGILESDNKRLEKDRNTYCVANNVVLFKKDCTGKRKW